jgi:hypothetical protein
LPKLRLFDKIGAYFVKFRTNDFCKGLSEQSHPQQK